MKQKSSPRVNPITGTSRHEQLIDAGLSASNIRSHLLIPKQQRLNWLRHQYKKHFNIGQDDICFVAGLAYLEVDGELAAYEDGEQVTPTHNILHGHRWLVDHFDPNLDELIDAGLIRKPRINGKERERLINRRYWDLTPSGRSLIDVDWHGEGVGDLGEGIVHRLGTWLTYHWMSEFEDRLLEPLPDKTPIDLSRYHAICEHEFDVVMSDAVTWSDDDPRLAVYYAAEIEADSLHAEHTATDARKMASIAGRSFWVFPTREVLADSLESLAVRGFVDLSVPVPETLALTNHRDTYNKRLESTSQHPELSYDSVSRVYTYSQLARELKAVRPDLFYFG